MCGCAGVAVQALGRSLRDVLISAPRECFCVCVEKFIDGASPELKMLICAVGKPFNSSHVEARESL